MDEGKDEIVAFGYRNRNECSIIDNNEDLLKSQLKIQDE